MEDKFLKFLESIDIEVLHEGRSFLLYDPNNIEGTKRGIDFALSKGYSLAGVSQNNYLVFESAQFPNQVWILDTSGRPVSIKGGIKSIDQNKTTALNNAINPPKENNQTEQPKEEPPKAQPSNDNANIGEGGVSLDQLKAYTPQKLSKYEILKIRDTIISTISQSISDITNNTEIQNAVGGSFNIELDAPVVLNGTYRESAIAKYKRMTEADNQQQPIIINNPNSLGNQLVTDLLTDTKFRRGQGATKMRIKVKITSTSNQPVKLNLQALVLMAKVIAKKLDDQKLRVKSQETETPSKNIGQHISTLMGQLDKEVKKVGFSCGEDAKKDYSIIDDTTGTLVITAMKTSTTTMSKLSQILGKSIANGSSGGSSGGISYNNLSS